MYVCDRVYVRLSQEVQWWEITYIVYICVYEYYIEVTTY